MNTAPTGQFASPQAAQAALSDEALCARIAAMRTQMLTVCAWTHRIKYEGEWMPPDLFLHRCLQIPITHGIAPDVVDLVLGDIPAA
ncbi:MAG: hypothetical protein IAE82_02745 [Opitutaceae bacterium]|nr:hypothetical protein [Opitutaceae bacterium]